MKIHELKEGRTYKNISGEIFKIIDGDLTYYSKTLKNWRNAIGTYKSFNKLDFEEIRVRPTKEEIALLKMFDKQWKYIVRDKNQKLYIYSHAPIKDDFHGCWNVKANMMNINYLLNIPFTWIQWEDENPTCIEGILEEYDSEDVNKWDLK